MITESIGAITDTGRKISDSCLGLIDAISRPKLKVALISFYYEKPTISGVGIHARNLARFLAKNNCKVHVFCSGEEEATYREDGVTVHVIGKIFTPIEDKFSKKRLEYDLFESEAIREIIRESAAAPFDILHTHGSLTKSAFILRKIYGTKWVHTFHAIEKLRVKSMSREEKEFADLVSWIESTVNYCDGAIFVSRDLIGEGMRHYRIKSATVIPNGIDLDLFKPSPIRRKNVLFIGRFSKDKGIHLLAKMIPEIMEGTDASMTLIAPLRSNQGELKNIREEIRRQEERYPGRLTVIDQPMMQEELPGLYRNCQVYIQPSKYESFGLCILEAMASGRSVVAFSVGGIPEVVADAGYLAKNMAGLTKKVKALLNDRPECERIGRKAAARAKRFDWNEIAKETIHYYNKVRGWNKT